MSNAVVTPAYKTRLGNPTAKAVLALLADKANDDGFAFPSTRHIAGQTELSERQVQRIIQVFGKMGLVAKYRAQNQQYDHYFIINLSMLGRDLSDLFTVHFDEAQGKTVSQTGVSQTGATVSQTENSVSQTEPPHPHKGVTISEPPSNQGAFVLSSEPRPKKTAKSSFLLPDWVDEEVWAAFEEMRKRIRAPLTDHARNLLVKKLAGIVGSGGRRVVVEVLNQSIVNGWRDVFELRKPGGSRGQNQQYSSRNRHDEALEELRKSGVEVEAGSPEEGAAEVCASQERRDGCRPPGIILEGDR